RMRVWLPPPDTTAFRPELILSFAIWVASLMLSKMLALAGVVMEIMSNIQNNATNPGFLIISILSCCCNWQNAGIHYSLLHQTIITPHASASCSVHFPLLSLLLHYYSSFPQIIFQQGCPSQPEVDNCCIIMVVSEPLASFFRIIDEIVQFVRCTPRHHLHII